MLKIILISIAAIIVIFLIVVAMRPAEFTVKRSVKISAPPSGIFDHVNDLHQFQEWSPWAKMDPDAKTSFEGPPAGVGAAFSWEGKTTGAGKMTGIESIPGEVVRYQLDFKKPFVATNIGSFTLKPEGGQTEVTWAMSGKKNFVFKAFGMFVDCDKMIGKDFEKGLADLKTLVESQPKQP